MNHTTSCHCTVSGGGWLGRGRGGGGSGGGEVGGENGEVKRCCARDVIKHLLSLTTINVHHVSHVILLLLVTKNRQTQLCEDQDVNPAVCLHLRNSDKFRGIRFLGLGYKEFVQKNT